MYDTFGTFGRVKGLMCVWYIGKIEEGRILSETLMYV